MALVLQRALVLLRLFTVARPEIGLSEAARLAGESKATVYRLLTTLCEAGLVELVEARKTYRLGPTVLELARVREATVPLVSVVQPVLAQLLERTGETCHFSRFNGSTMAVVAAAESRKVNRITMAGLESLPVCSTAAGQAFLAFAEAEVAAKVMEREGLSNAERTALDGQLRRIAVQGHATVELFDGEEIFGMACPVRGGGGAVFGSLAVVIPPNRVTSMVVETTLTAIREGCAALAESLGAPAEG